MEGHQEGEGNDLFEFEGGEGAGAFGVVPGLSPEGAQEAVEADAKKRIVEEAVEAEIRAANTGSSPSDQDPLEFTWDDEVGESIEVNPARPNPPLPPGVVDLDEDLFRFDEVFPAVGGAPAPKPQPSESSVATTVREAAETVSAPPLPSLDSALAEARPEPERSESQRSEPQRPESRGPEIKGPESQHRASKLDGPQDPSPRRDTREEREDERKPRIRISESRETRRREPTVRELRERELETPKSRRTMVTTEFDRGPKIVLPEDQPGAEGSSERSRLIAACVACFVALNTGILLIAYFSNVSFQTSIARATDVIAEALATRAEGTSAQAPVVVVPDLSHALTEPAPRRSAPFQPEAWIDPTDYAGTHEFAVANAKALLAEGRFDDARMLLNHVLANQARIPLAPALREEIDYLIPLTYYEQGNATALEEGEG